MKIKTSELKRDALNWAVAQAMGRTDVVCHGTYIRLHTGGKTWAYDPSTDWREGGPIIEGACMELVPWPEELDEDKQWRATQHLIAKPVTATGHTPLIAAMRCFVKSRLGDEVEIPEGLLEGVAV